MSRLLHAYIQSEIEDYLPFLQKWLELKLGKNGKSNDTFLVKNCIILALKEMFEEVDKNLIDSFLENTKKQGLFVSEIDMNTFKKFLK